MRILIDECVDQTLRSLLAEHECQTTGYAGLSGLKNGALLAAAEAAHFEVLITTDQGIPHQQNMLTRLIAVVVLCAPTDLEPLLPATIKALNLIKPGQVFRIA